MLSPPPVLLFFFFNDTATTEIYTLSLHDALPISNCVIELLLMFRSQPVEGSDVQPLADRKSTRLNSSHLVISYAVFCLKKKKNSMHTTKLLQCSCKPCLTRMHPPPLATLRRPSRQ